MNTRIVKTLCIITGLFCLIGCGNKEQNDDNLNIEIEIESIEETEISNRESYVAVPVELKEISAGISDRMFLTADVFSCEEAVIREDAYNYLADRYREEESEYANFAIANVDNYVNVRSGPNTDSEIVAKLYDGSVAQIQEIVTCEDGDWLSVVSGNATGYIKAEYFIYGDEAVNVIEDYVDRYAVVNADRLNIRESPDLEAKRIGYAVNGEKLKIIGPADEWIKVNYADGKTGYVFAEYVTVKEEFIYAKTIEEEKAEKAKEAELMARQKESEKAKPENTKIVEQTPAQMPTGYTASGDLRTDIVNNALQYIGCPYVHGGNSLTNGTDCSGFTSLIYAQYGYGLSRTPSGQLSSNGRSVGLDEIRPGDIVCYGKSKCTHVAIYIGNGQIVHAANPRKGIVTQNVGYDNILGIKNVID